MRSTTVARSAASGPTGRANPRSGRRPDCSALLTARAPAQNSLRGLRPLRSDNCAESVHEARSRARALAAALLDAGF